MKFSPLLVRVEWARCIARDTRLDRIVAIKVLPTHLADRSELRERFEREARTIAGLNHPHICTLHDIGQQDGTDYLVMEYLEGETLAQRLSKGPLPLEQVLQYAIEISDALDKAHRKGVTHRDLKPGNIMLTKSGTKLLDFGLAKLKQEAAPANASLSDLSTANDPLTAQGTILGTLNYMAPEQVEGKSDEIDARTDIFAFGTVIYEMATGKRAFEGKSQASLIAAILEREPPAMSALQPMTPPAFDRVVKKCLAKEPAKRWQAASDVCDELKWVAGGGSHASVSVPIAAKGFRLLGQWELVLGAAASLLVATIVAIAVWNLKPAPLQQVTRTVINLPPGQQLAGLDSGPAVALSPDGSHLAYVARQAGVQQLYLRAMDSLESKPISGTEGAVNPFFSPDGQWLGFFGDAKLKKVSVSGGSALTLVDPVFPFGASWGSNGMIAFGPTSLSVLQQVPDAGGIPQPLTRFEKGEISQRWPEFLPGARSLLFASTTGTNNQVVAQLVGSSERQNLTGGMNPRYAPSGHLVYAQGGNLMAVPFDPRRLEVTGPAVLVAESVMQFPINGYAQYSFSSSGSLAYVSGRVQASQTKLVWVNRNGAEEPLNAPAHAYLAPRLSPDGRRIAIGVAEQESQTWLYDLSRDTLTRFTFDGNTNLNPVWIPDGKRIAFVSNRDGQYNIFWQLADGSGGLERLTTGEYLQAPQSWSPDGQLLAFIEVNPTTQRDVWVLRLGNASTGSGQAGKAQPFLHTRFEEAEPRFSPDGRWLAYFSNESGRDEIYVQPYPGPGGKWQISTEGGTEPVWNPNGRELFYRTGDKMMVVDVAAQPSFVAGKPRMLFERPYEPARIPTSNFDVSADGQRFLMLKPTQQAEAAPTQINVVLNWFEELKRHVPTSAK